VIRASPEHIFAYLARVEHLPRYGSPLWMIAEPMEKRGSAQTVALSGYFAGLPIESILRVALHPPVTLELTQMRGTLRSFAGRCTLERGEDGTEVFYHLEVDPGIPMVTDDAARQFLMQYLTRLLDRIKLAAERKVPVRRPQAPSAAAPAASAPPEMGEAEPEPDEEPAPPIGVEERAGGAAASAARADAHPPAHAPAVSPPLQAAGTGQPPLAGRPSGPPERRPGGEGTSTGRRRRHRRRRRRPRGGPSAASGRPGPPAS
jgi:Polyketide cyclase / dehydrase and lipid transport